jgi:hypothetical protein
MIEKASDYIAKRNIELSRMWILEASFCILSLYSAIMIVLNQLIYMQLIEQTIFTMELLFCFVVGGMGAILSLMLRLGGVSFDYYAAERSHWYECIAKAIIGSFSGMLIYILVQIDFILPFLKDRSATSTLYFVVLAFIAGATERFIPSILNTYKISKQEDQ